MRVVQSNLADQAFEIVRERILSADIQPLASIRQDLLANELGISKIPLREALTRLEQTGLLRSSPKKGFFVSPLTAAEAEEIFELRLRLEPDAAARACLLADEAQQQLAKQAHERLAAIPEHANAGRVTAHRQFHLALVHAHSHQLTTHLLEQLHVLADRYVSMHLQPEGRTQRANIEHCALLDAWLKRDATQVRQCLDQHLSRTMLDLRSQLASSAA